MPEIPKDKTGKPIPPQNFDNDFAPADKPPKKGDNPVGDWLDERIEKHKPKS